MHVCILNNLTYKRQVNLDKRQRMKKKFYLSFVIPVKIVLEDWQK